MYYLNQIYRLMGKFITYVLYFFIAFAFQSAKAQQPPFYKEIQEFKKQDSVRMPPSKAILFTGSSTFRMWKGLQDSFPKHTIINRAFGGSSLPHLIMYANDVILPYKPKQIVVYC